MHSSENMNREEMDGRKAALLRKHRHVEETLKPLQGCSQVPLGVPCGGISKGEVRGWNGGRKGGIFGAGEGGTGCTRRNTE